MSIWGFIFVLAATIFFIVAAFLARATDWALCLSIALALFGAGFIFTFCTTSSPVHF
jgi:hypothetical protein